MVNTKLVVSWVLFPKNINDQRISMEFQTLENHAFSDPGNFSIRSSDNFCAKRSYDAQGPGGAAPTWGMQEAPEGVGVAINEEVISGESATKEVSQEAMFFLTLTVQTEAPDCRGGQVLLTPC